MTILDLTIKNTNVAKLGSIFDADELKLRYYGPTGDIIFKINDCDFSTSWGWVSILDVAASLKYALTEVRRGQHIDLEFTESSDFISFIPSGNHVSLSTSYCPGYTSLPVEELSDGCKLFLKKCRSLILQLLPELLHNSAFEKILSENSI